MLKIFSIFDRFLPQAQPTGDEPHWVCDLLRHPDIARMDARQLGDLPFPGPFPRRMSTVPRDACRA